MKHSIKNVKWAGTLTHKKEKHEFTFDNFVFWVDNSVFGNGTDAIGEFNIEGKFEAEGTLTFEKTYFKYFDEAANDKPSKTIVYEGTHDLDDCISGTWKVKDDDLNNSFWKKIGLSKEDNGTFDIKCTLPEWHGTFIQDGEELPMDMNLNISETDGVYGTGFDDISNWFCAGKIVGNRVHLRKYYRDNYHVDYEGELTQNIGEMPI